MVRKLAAEFIGTFCLVFFGTGAIVVNELYGGMIGHAGIAIVFGFVVMAMIYSFGQISGAHFNPAVTLGFAIAKEFKLNEVAGYIFIQCAGAVFASLVLHILFPENVRLGATIPSGSNMQSFILEVILTFVLMLVILNVSHGSKEVGIMAGIAIGATVLIEAMFAGPVCGASMNPARSLGPEIVSGVHPTLWIYIVAPVAGAGIAAVVWKLLFVSK